MATNAPRRQGNSGARRFGGFSEQDVANVRRIYNMRAWNRIGRRLITEPVSRLATAGRMKHSRVI